jgi:hypothetical protein
MQKAKPLSLFPLDFDAAMRALVKIPKDAVTIKTPKKRKRLSERKKRK